MCLTRRLCPASRAVLPAAGYNVPSNGCDLDTGAAVVFTPAAPLGLSGVRPTARPTAEFSYRCYATGPPQNRPCTSWSRPGGSTWADPCNVTTVAELSAPAGAVLAAAVTYGDGRETLAIALEWWVLGQLGWSGWHALPGTASCLSFRDHLHSIRSCTRAPDHLRQVATPVTAPA